VENVRLQRDLVQLLRREDLRVWFQPQFSLQDRTLAGFEALSRWHHPTLGLLEAARFIRNAEQVGALAKIDQWALETAVEALADNLRGTDETVGIAANISAPWLVSHTPEDTVALCRDHGIAPQRVTLEIDGCILADPRHDHQASLAALREVGFRIALDRFGMGAASLHQLITAPLDAVKIDRSLVIDAPRHRPLAAVLHATITAARNLGLVVQINDLEKPCEVAMVQAMEADIGQGFALGRPTPAEQTLIPEQLERRAG